jgi:hypothetical protein
MQAHPQDATAQLAEVERLRRRTRASFGQPWFPMAVFGGVAVAAAPALAVANMFVLVPLWIVAGGVGMVAIQRFYRRRANARGVVTRGRRSWFVGVAIAVLSLVAGYVGGAAAGVSIGLLMPAVVVLGGYAALSWLQHDLVPFACATPATLSTVLLVGRSAAPWLIELAYGGAMMIGAVLLFLHERRGRWAR